MLRNATQLQSYQTIVVFHKPYKFEDAHFVSILLNLSRFRITYIYLTLNVIEMVREY